MTPLLARSIHARKRPVAVAFVFLMELAWALLVATPVHAWARRVWGGHPDGDAVLWADGARDLMVWLGQSDAALPVTARTTIVLLAVGTVLMQLPFGVLVTSLAFGRMVETDEEGTVQIRSLRLRSALQVAVSAFLPLAVLLVLGSVTSVIVLVLGWLAASGLDNVLTEALGDARSFTVGAVVFGVFAAVAAVIGIVIDLARAAVVRESGLSAASGTAAPAWNVMLRGVRIALKTSRASLGRAVLGWTGRTVVGVALVAIGFVAADVLGGSGGVSLTLLFIVHQAVVLGRVALRASWMARALVLVVPVQDEPAPAPPT
ncbi:MAG: hypothetical protein QOI41_6520 [Myxococcales bacterium]|jgi:hypothetical protein|nr:hypothetical protein [Myxococcales bacterium]